MRLLQPLAFLCLLSALVTQGVDCEPVLATVYYEAKCPYSRDFVVQQLLPAVLRDPELIRPVLVPFGKANVTATPEGYDFACQHGPSECLGNRLHACGTALAASRTLQISYAACLISDYTDVQAAAQECADELGLPFSTISECANGTAGSELMRAYGNTTKDLSPPLTSVPTVTLNGNRGNQTAILYDFWEEVVKLSQETEGRSGSSRSGGRSVGSMPLLLLLLLLPFWGLLVRYEQ
ncbi:GILT-like protein 1 isoform X1 [Schistocerca cancellata]|uniref:GILT-like protein 1 isoform X1 n=1 Tax=Schistocerca cancellata TaxID=274614 RepID=UPI0021175675|nr:GILT-like protein 1 isoform X1 [Schistocerca cancellata]